MSLVTLPNNLQPNTNADANAVMANFNALAGAINGNIDTTNIGPAGINVSVLVGAISSLTSPGSIVLPGNIILKWGLVNCPGDGSSPGVVTFGTAFPNAMFGALVSVKNVFSSNPQGISAQWDTPAVPGFNATAFGASSNTAVPVFYLAIGY